jgi:hypothetical protein
MYYVDGLTKEDIGMRTRHIWLIPAIAVAFIFGGVLEAQTAATKEERESYKKQIEEKLKTIEKQIGELKDKGAGVKAEAKAEYKKEMKELKNKEKTAIMKWKHLKRSKHKVWDKVKAEMDAAVVSLESAYERIAERFRKQ